MRPKTTRGLLERLVSRVNVLTGHPTLAWNIGDWDEEAQAVNISPNVGTYFLSHFDAGYRVEQMQEHGTSTDVLGSERLTAREQEVQLRAYIAGLENKSNA